MAYRAAARRFFSTFSQGNVGTGAGVSRGMGVGIGSRVGMAATSASARMIRRGGMALAMGMTAFTLATASTAFAASSPAPTTTTSPAVERKAPPIHGIPGTNLERTFIAIKPDGVQRGLIGKIIQRFEEKGFTLVAMKFITPTEAKAAGHYDDLKTKPFFPGLVKFFSSGPIVAMVWQGKGAIKTGRKMLGETKPEESPVGSIRGDYAVEIGRNICHGSDSPEGAAHEIAFWFTEGELYNWTPETLKWVSESA